jgi:alpha-galactosidase/6-phospho-beta-glucosidase family protein
MPTLHPAHANGKRCTKCETFKPASCFAFRSDQTGKLKSWCAECLKIDGLTRFYADPDRKRKANERAAKAYTKNPDKFRRRRQEWRRSNPDRAREIDRLDTIKRKAKKAAYRKANAERIKARNVEYRKREAAKLKTYNAGYYKANAVAVNARIKRAVAANPALYQQLHKAAKHRRKVRLVNSGPVEKFTDREIFERDGWVCQLCRKPVDRTLVHPEPLSPSLDHRLPIAKGGGHTRANVQLAHLRCNLSKRDRHTAAA